MPEAQIADTVADEETLYRRVPNTSHHYTREPNGLQVTAQAFSEPPIPEGEPYAGQYRLSVDRAKLRGFRPELTQQAATKGDPSDYGVVCMPVRAVRTIPDVEDVIPDPLLNVPEVPDNPSHALVCIRPSPANTKNANKNIARTVFHALADLANRTPWPVEPRQEYQS